MSTSRIGLNKNFAAAIGILLFILIWWLTSLSSPLVPSPLRTLEALMQILGDRAFFDDFIASARRVSYGFGLAFVVAASIFFASYFSPAFLAIISVPIEILRPIPPLAWIPISIVLFGLTDSSSVFIIFLGAFFPLYSACVYGLKVDSVAYMSLAELLRRSTNRNLPEVLIPSSATSIMSGMRISIGFAWMCVVVAEMTYARSGLGYQLQLQRQLLALDHVVAYMAIIGAVGALLVGFISVVERHITPWRFQSERGLGRASLIGRVEQCDSSSQKMPINVSLKEVAFAYDARANILTDVNLEIKDCEIVSVVGASGTGKTTLLRLIAGDLVPADGRVTINEIDAIDCDKPAWILQDSGLFPWMTVIENVLFQFHKSHNLEDPVALAKSWIGSAGLGLFENRYPHSLSGGQKQRVQLVRSLVAGRSLILMDEPFSKLDSITKKRLIEDFVKFLHEDQLTAIIVTHDLNDAFLLSDRIVVLGHAAGAVTKVGDFSLGDFSTEDRAGASGFSDRRRTIEENIYSLLSTD